jgi:hypothetical protein
MLVRSFEIDFLLRVDNLRVETAPGDRTTKATHVCYVVFVNSSIMVVARRLASSHLLRRGRCWGYVVGQHPNFPIIALTDINC